VFAAGAERRRTFC